jgi:hypothetical protein
MRRGADAIRYGLQGVIITISDCCCATAAAAAAAAATSAAATSAVPAVQVLDAVHRVHPAQLCLAQDPIVCRDEDTIPICAVNKHSRLLLLLLLLLLADVLAGLGGSRSGALPAWKPGFALRYKPSGELATIAAVCSISKMEHSRGCCR